MPLNKRAWGCLEHEAAMLVYESRDQPHWLSWCTKFGCIGAHNSQVGAQNMAALVHITWPCWCTKLGQFSTQNMATLVHIPSIGLSCKGNPICPHMSHHITDCFMWKNHMTMRFPKIMAFLCFLEIRHLAQPTCDTSVHKPHFYCLILGSLARFSLFGSHFMFFCLCLTSLQ